MSIAGFKSARARRLEALRAKYAPIATNEGGTPRHRSPPKLADVQSTSAQVSGVEGASSPTSSSSCFGEFSGASPHASGSPIHSNSVPSRSFTFPCANALPWTLSPLVKNFAIKLPSVRRLMQKVPALASAITEGAPARVLWVVSLWDRDRNRISANTDVDGMEGGDVVFANANSSVNFLRVQLRVGASRVVVQGALHLTSQVSQDTIRGSCSSSLCQVKLVGTADLSVGLSVGLCVTSFWHRWGKGSADVLIEAGATVQLVWISQEDFRDVGNMGRFVLPDSKTKEAGGRGDARYETQSPQGSRSPGSRSSLLDEPGVQNLLRTSSHNPNPTMVLDMIFRLIDRSSLPSLRRNSQLMMRALTAVWQRCRTHNPGAAVVVKVTDAFAHFLVRLLGGSLTSNFGKSVNGFRNNEVQSDDAEFGRLRSRAIQLLETVVWDEAPAEMLVTSLQTTLDRIIISLQRAGRSSASSDFSDSSISPAILVANACHLLEAACMLLAVGDSSEYHDAKLSTSAGVLKKNKPGEQSTLRKRWDTVAAKILPVLTAASRHLELFATVEEASIATMPLLRGLAAVLPPLLSRASPRSVAKHIAAFMSSLPLRALNPSAMEMVIALLSNIYEHGFKAAKPSSSLSSYNKSALVETGLRIAAVELLEPTISLLHRLAEAALPQEGDNGTTTAVTNSECIPSSWPSLAALLARAFDLAISAGNLAQESMHSIKVAVEMATAEKPVAGFTSLLMGLLDVSQELLSIVSGEIGALCPHHQGFCMVVMSGLESLLLAENNLKDSNEGHHVLHHKSTPFADACANLDPSRLTSVVTGLIHAMNSAIKTRSKLRINIDKWPSIDVDDHIQLVWLLDHRDAPASFSQPKIDLHTLFAYFRQLTAMSKVTTSSVVEDASLSSAKLSLAMTIFCSITESLPGSTSSAAVLQSGEEMSKILRNAHFWVSVIQKELQKPDMSLLDPRASSVASAKSVIESILSAGLSCCLTSQNKKSNGHLREPISSLGQICIECALASLVSGPGGSGHFAVHGADRERASHMLAWFQNKLESASTFQKWESEDVKQQRMHERSALKKFSEMVFASINTRLQYLASFSSKSQLWEVNDGARELPNRLTWEEISAALKCFHDFIPVLCNAEVGNSRVSMSDPQEHRLAEALSKLLVWWSRVEPALALPYADGLVRLHQATGNNHARVLSLVAKARLTGALVTQKVLPWRVYACTALAAASAVREAKINDATALDLCRHAHRHVYGRSSTTNGLRSIHERLLSVSESILNDMHEKRIDHVTSLETSSCWFAVRMSDPEELEEYARGSGSSWYVYRHDAWVSTDDFIAELRESYPTYRVLAPSHPVPRSSNKSDDGMSVHRNFRSGSETNRKRSQPINHYYKATLSTLLPKAKEMQVFVCHPEGTGSKNSTLDAVTTVTKEFAREDMDEEWGDPNEGKTSALSVATTQKEQEDNGETYILHAFTVDRNTNRQFDTGYTGSGERLKPTRSYHAPIRHSSFGATPAVWHKSDTELGGQIVRVALHVHSGKVLRGLCRRQRASNVVMKDVSSTEACNEWITRQKRRIHDFMRKLSGPEANNRNGSSPDEEDLKSVLIEIEKMLSHKDTTAVSLATALRLTVYYREWEEGYQKKTGNELKREWIREKRKNEKEGLPPPKKPDFAAIVQAEKNLPVEQLVKLFTSFVTLVEDALDILESDYGIDVEHCRSLLSSIYGADVGDDISGVENEANPTENYDPTNW